jgi:hypothetical protein
MSAAEQIRVSCASLCRFLVDDRLLLLLNHNRRAQGIYELSPLGGALEAFNEDIFARFAVQRENENSLDLRFFMDPGHLDEFRKWFQQRKDRETDPFREIYEELVEETQVLPDIKRHDLRIFYRYTHESEKVTQRSGVSGQLTHYFLDVFEVWAMSPMVKHQLNMLTQSSGVLLLNKKTARHTESVQMTVDDATRSVPLNVAVLFEG